MILLGRILATLVISLGVATGNVSSNNTKNGNALITNEAEKQQSKPIQNAAFTETYTYTLKTSYDEVVNNNTYHNEKWYLNNNVNATTEYGNIYNSIYVLNRPANIGRESVSVGLYSITPYITSYGSNANFKSIYRLEATGAGYSVHLQVHMNAYLADQRQNQYIDLTTYNAGQVETALYDIYGGSNGIANNDDEITIPPNTNYSLTLNVDLGTISEPTYIYIVTKTLMTYQSGQNPEGSYIKIEPNEMTINGYHNDINYEVIDLPGLMLDIITMPFTFISQAFNLTVFPGTPYAFNFGNIFLTLIAAFILIWLLKKVFK